MPIPNDTKAATFKIDYRSNVSNNIAAVICAPIRAFDFTVFDSVDQALSRIVEITRKRFNSDIAMVECYGNEMTSRINSMKMNRVDETYEALSPLTQKGDALTFNRITSNIGHVPLNKLSVYGARTLINLFVSTYIDTLLEMVKKYDDENVLNDVLKNDPTNFWMTLKELLSCCAGYPDFDMARI